MSTLDEFTWMLRYCPTEDGKILLMSIKKTRYCQCASGSFKLSTEIIISNWFEINKKYHLNERGTM